MRFELESLPYEPDDLQPHISGETVAVHYGKHHAGYLAKLADEIEGKPIGDLPLEEIVRNAPGKGSIFRNAAQVWNHTFYWKSLAPEGGGKPGGKVADLLKRDFGSIDDFKQKFAEAALAQFGSGWAWLVADPNGRLKIVTTSDADNPMRDEMQPLLTLDVWEHAYYLDYRNERGKYVEACLENLLNWQFAESNYEIAAARDSAYVETGSKKIAEGSR